MSTLVKPSVDKTVKNSGTHVGIIGLGYVGLPLALLFASRGFRVTGFDYDQNKVDSIASGNSYLGHIPDDAVRRYKGRLTATMQYDALGTMDAIVICVPTPLDRYRQPDLSFVENAADTIRRYLQPGQLIILESTTFPGTTEEIVLPVLTRSGLHCMPGPYALTGGFASTVSDSARDFFLAYSPERENPGRDTMKLRTIPKIVGGINGQSARAATALYGRVFDHTFLVSSTRIAEMAKLLENSYRCVNIALVNELKLLCQRMNLDVWEVIEAARTKPFGFQAFHPGPGIGGHCIPVDPQYLSWKARDYDFVTRMVDLACEVNAAMPEHTVRALEESLGRKRICLSGSRILVVGVSYKKDSDDIRESPALRVLSLLAARGAEVSYHDPNVPRLEDVPSLPRDLASVDLSASSLRGYAAVFIATDHSTIDYELIGRHAHLIVDSRNAMRSIPGSDGKTVYC